MTTAVQLGIQRIEAMDKLNQQMREIADLIGVQPVDMPVQSKYGADYLVVRQLEAMEQWAEALKVALTPVTVITPPVIDDTPEARERAANKLNEPAAKFAVEFPMAAIEVSADPTPRPRGRKKAE